MKTTFTYILIATLQLLTVNAVANESPTCANGICTPPWEQDPPPAVKDNETVTSVRTADA